MAIWQFRLILIPIGPLYKQFKEIPVELTVELAEDFAWWFEIQPRAGFEKQIDSILVPMNSWSESMTMWGEADGNNAYVVYADKNKSTVEEICFRVDARAASKELVSAICLFAKQLDCVLMTSDYKLLPPEQRTILQILQNSTAKKFVDDPEATLLSLDHEKIEERMNNFLDGSKPPRQSKN